MARGALWVTFAVASLIGAAAGVSGDLLTYRGQFSVGPAQAAALLGAAIRVVTKRHRST